MDRVTFASSSGFVWLALAALGDLSALSFFLGQMKFIPEPVRVVPLLLALAFLPILFLIHWMWRVRVRGRLSGLAVDPAPPVR